MNVQTLVKLPFRIGRAVFRAVRDELRTSLEGGTSKGGTHGPSPSPTPVAPSPTPVAPSPAPPVRPVAPTPAVAAPARPSPPREPVEVRVEETPNPDARKFVCSRTVVPEGSIALNGPDNARGIPFADAVFRLDGIRTVFATKDFVTVTRRPDSPSWDVLTPGIVEALRRTI